jgi:regulator of RNase E activity RraA
MASFGPLGAFSTNSRIDLKISLTFLWGYALVLTVLAFPRAHSISALISFLILRPVWDCTKIVGRASTVEVGPKTNAAPAVHLLTPVIDAVQTDDRILVNAGGIDGISCWGDILANASKGKRIRGTVIDGMSRDIDGGRDIGYPVYGRGVTMISARDRVV